MYFWKELKKNPLQKWLQKWLQTPLQNKLQTPLHVLQHAYFLFASFIILSLPPWPTAKWIFLATQYMSSRQTKYLISSSWDFLRFMIFVTSPHCNTSYLHKQNLSTTLHLLKKIKKIRLILRSSYGKGKQTILNFDSMRYAIW